MDLQGVSYTESNGVLIVSIKSDLYSELAIFIQDRIFETVRNKEMTGVLVELSSVDLLDSFSTRILLDISKGVKLLGARTLFTGIRPEVAASIVDLGLNFDQFEVVRSLDDGIAQLKNSI